MTLLITVFAAVLATVAWYKDLPERKLNLAPLLYMYWGASLMWLVDALFEYAQLKAEYFTPPIEDIINDGFLGLSAVAFGLVIWVAILLIKDPKGLIKNNILKSK